ncbi:MAG: ADP-ribosylglycohydrolase family protein [Oscillatoria princeps RMCB-10]|jgi:ADP-ribosylglycohydrolase|nr:ADP-ribosylglycohydrolase family protein [Oscillatoria princeps RMCB-10]
MNETIANRIRGVIFGQALGDALGEGVEFLSKPQIEQYYPKGLKEPLQDLRWLRWTDDTAQMLCILDSLLSQKRVDVLNIAAHFHHWAETDGRGIGNTVYSVVHDPDFLEKPHEVAQRFWENSWRQAAANGAVMRTSALGIWEYPFPDKVKYNAEEVCKITHADPRYTLKAMGAGFWALQYAESWDDGVLKVLEEGGDADTNAAVAGALLGARFGGDRISQTWVEKLRNVGELERRAQQVIAVAQQWS